MELTKFKNYHMKNYPPKVEYLAKEIEERVSDEITLEYIQQLAETCYKVGFRDGDNFSQWLENQIQ